MALANVCGSISVYSLATVRRLAPRVLSPAATWWALNPIRVIAATLLNSSAGNALLDAMPNSTRVPYSNTKSSTGTNRWRTPAIVSVCQCAWMPLAVRKAKKPSNRPASSNP